MKGLVFRGFEKMILQRYGPDLWERLLDEAPLKTSGGGFIGPQTYPDEDLAALIATASRLTGESQTHLTTAFGRFLFPHFARIHPVFMKPGLTAKSFLQTVHGVIHVEVRKLHAGAHLPEFSYEDPAPDRLVMVYVSGRKLCYLAAGLIEGVGDYYQETIEATHTRCLHRGDPHCRFELRFRPAPKAGPV